MSNLPVNEIICGDCLEVMKDWPDNCVDLVFFDPPYNVNAKYKNYKDNLGPLIYENFIRNTIRQSRRLSDSKIIIILGSAAKILLPWWTHLKDAKLLIVKMGAFSHNRIKGFSLQYHTVLTTAKNISHTWSPDLWEDIRWPGEGYYFNEERYGHPAMTPLKLAYRLIELCTKENDIVCDIYCGSGTVCVAAKMLGRRYIGIDVSSEYCKIAEMRLKAVDTGVSVKEQKIGQKGLWE